MKLQAALDCPTLGEAVAILNAVSPWIDIAEIGSVGMYEGLRASRVIRDQFPQLEILNDLKIHDGGYSCTRAAYENGADYVTVLAAAEDITILQAVRAGRDFGIKVVADMIGCQNLVERMRAVDQMGVDYIAVHLAVDAQDPRVSPLEDLQIARLVVKNAGLSVAGGVGPAGIEKIAACQPDIVVSGGAICGAENPAEAARAIKEVMVRYG